MPWNVSFQQDPQFGPPISVTTCAPPIFGKEGRSPNVGNLDAIPLSPWPHATVSKLASALSYAVSNDTLSAKAEVTNMKREAMGAMNFILESQKMSNSICLSSGTLINLLTGLLGYFIPCSWKLSPDRGWFGGLQNCKDMAAVLLSSYRRLLVPIHF